jgi:hypothetical protein
MSDAVTPNHVPAMSAARARAILRQHGVADPVALIGVRGYAPEMGTPGVNDLGVYDDAIFLVTSNDCTGFIANTDPCLAEPPNVQLKAGTWRYKPGTHTPRESGQGYPALVETGRPEDAVWVIARPRTADDYQLFARSPNIQLRQDLPTVEAYQAEVVANGGRVMPNGEIEWRMAAHINIHRGGTTDPGSKGCQTVYPAQWAGFIDAVHSELAAHNQATIGYVLIEAAEFAGYPA